MDKIKKIKNNNLKVIDLPQDNSIPILEKMLENLKQDKEWKGTIFIKVYADGIEYVMSSFLDMYPQHVIAGLEKIKFDLLANSFSSEDTEYSFLKPPPSPEDDPPKAS